jgi:hypothetical protein
MTRRGACLDCKSSFRAEQGPGQIAALSAHRSTRAFVPFIFSRSPSSAATVAPSLMISYDCPQAMSLATSFWPMRNIRPLVRLRSIALGNAHVLVDRSGVHSRDC